MTSIRSKTSSRARTTIPITIANVCESLMIRAAPPPSPANTVNGEGIKSMDVCMENKQRKNERKVSVTLRSMTKKRVKN